ncbi:GGDEF domain-containing protein [Cryobacterium arcticum]|uniref:GGDEF domain-containing protein n=1 Tax=Cryobacterium arcticum TaxID=670052 RepID=A0A1B1BJZ6_9MICO|nr:GGDEF domain-containing protein [Cryobacterium arcticum]ANP72989.1 hypothetical protein PA27867_2037 [Cryobacterium arcticum]
MIPLTRPAALLDRWRAWRGHTTPFASVSSAAALVVALSGVLDAANPSPDTLGTDWTWAWTLIACVVALLPVAVAERFPRWIAVAACFAFVAVTALQMFTSDQGLKSVNNLVLYPMLACYVGWFFARPLARLIVALALVLSGVAVVLAPHPFLLPTWVNLALASVFCLEAAGHLRSKLDHEIRTDPLTGALNRSGLPARIDQELARALRTQQPLVLVLLDLDNFKQVNDVHGHAAGDRILVDLVRAVRSQFRPFDTIARVGGDEFLLLLPAIDPAGACEVLDRLRPLTGDTWSFGLAAAEPGDTAELLMERADKDLYATKKARR